MVRITSLVSCLALAVCSTRAHIEARQDASEALTIGKDGPADEETIGFTLNHISMNVANLTETMDFYGKALGMRHIFTAQISPQYSLTYMGHAHGGKNGSGFQTGEELLREKNNAAGLLEFQYFTDSTNFTASTRRVNTFGHIGLIVPSLQKAEERMDRLGYGANIIKRIGEPGIGNERVENALGVGKLATTDPKEKEALAFGQDMVGFSQLLVLEDPDGNMIEVQQLVPPPGVA